MGRRVGRVLALVTMLSAFAFVPRANAGSTITGPTVSVDHTDVNPGDHVIVTMDGFTALSVTISVCGNDARRGSQDCNMIASDGVRLDNDGTSTLARMPITAPPTDCPCVIRVSTPNNDEVAVTPITLIGHPIAPVVKGTTLTDPLAVTISAQPASVGFLQRLRPSLGGPTTYQVTVTVKNTSTESLHHLSVFGAAGRNADDNLVTLHLGEPGVLGAGQTWTQTVSAVVPAPSFGNLEWRVAVSGAGPTINTADTTSQRPTLLAVPAMVIVVNVSFLLIRSRMRRRAAREAVIETNTVVSEVIEAASADPAHAPHS